MTEGADVGDKLDALVGKVVAAEKRSGVVQGLLVGNLAAIITVIFFFGVTWQRVNNHDEQLKKAAAADSIIVQIQALQSEIQAEQKQTERNADRIDSIIRELHPIK